MQRNLAQRLRRDVGSLRRQTNELANLQAENQRLRSAPTTGNTRPRVEAQAPETAARLPRESWAFAGYADPESAFQTAIWARSQGDVKAYLASLSPDGIKREGFGNRPADHIAAEVKREMRDLAAFKIIDKAVVSDDEVVLTVYAEGINEGGRITNDAGKFRLQRIGTEWKLAGPVKDRDEPDSK